MWFLLIPAALLGALGNRLRGGLWGDKIRWGTGVARLCAWGIPSGLGAWALGIPWWAAAVVILGAWAGCTVPQFGGLSMGNRPGGTSGAAAWAGMTAWGLLRMGGAALVAWWFGGAWWFPLAAGLACAPVYAAVWLLPPSALFPGLGAPNDPPEMAEALHGALMGAALAAAFL